MFEVLELFKGMLDKMNSTFEACSKRIYSKVTALMTSNSLSNSGVIACFDYMSRVFATGRDSGVRDTKNVRIAHIKRATIIKLNFRQILLEVWGYQVLQAIITGFTRGLNEIGSEIKHFEPESFQFNRFYNAAHNLLKEITQQPKAMKGFVSSMVTITISTNYHHVECIFIISN